MLADVSESFGWYGIGLEPVQAPADSRQTNEENEDDEEPELEEYEEVEYYVDPEDVQGAMREAISALIREGYLPEFKNPKKPPTLADVFETLFGSPSEFKEQAEYFEELISGYQDRAHIDDLREAYNVLSEIIEKLTR